MDDGDPHEEIERLEAQIEALAARIENCRKFMLASRIAMGVGVVALGALLFGAIRFDPAWMAAAVAALLGGIVMYGSNSSTATEAGIELTEAEADRSRLIGEIKLRIVSDRPTLH